MSLELLKRTAAFLQTALRVESGVIVSTPDAKLAVFHSLERDICAEIRRQEAESFERIVIRQCGRGCRVWKGDAMVFDGGRIEAKREAMRLHAETGLPVFNVKKSGAIVPIQF